MLVIMLSGVDEFMDELVGHLVKRGDDRSHLHEVRSSANDVNELHCHTPVASTDAAISLIDSAHRLRQRKPKGPALGAANRGVCERPRHADASHHRALL
jgi:hypothetical protein